MWVKDAACLHLFTKSIFTDEALYVLQRYLGTAPSLGELRVLSLQNLGPWAVA